MIISHYLVGRVDAIAKPDFLKCPVRFLPQPYLQYIMTLCQVIIRGICVIHGIQTQDRGILP